MLIKCATVRDVISPSRGHATDAGIDFKCPKFTEEFLKDFHEKKPNMNVLSTIPHDKSKTPYLTVPPGENATIPSGVKVEIPYGYMGLFLNKSGVASKHDALIGAQVIDTFYSGEVHIDLHNVGNEDLIIEEGMKLAQMVIVPILNCDITDVSEDQLYDWMYQDSHRGEGGFGSTGK